MCGINGIPSINKNDCNDSIAYKIQKMNDLIAHRGPDLEGIYIKNPICFGFRRLSILDLTDYGNQPMLSTNGKIVIVFNGEIYNYIEIKRELIKGTFLKHNLI